MFTRKHFLYCICFGLLSCKSNENPYANNLNIEPAVIAELDTAHYTTIQWKDSIYNFGTITAGDSVDIKFNFTNVGNTPLFIFNTQTTCGCTVTDFPKEPVMPGKSDVITVTFKSGTLKGEIVRTVVVIANTRKSKRSHLIIRGMVQPADNQNQ
jgi:hypothetical protein